MHIFGNLCIWKFISNKKKKKKKIRNHKVFNSLLIHRKIKQKLIKIKKINKINSEIKK